MESRTPSATAYADIGVAILHELSQERPVGVVFLKPAHNAKVFPVGPGIALQFPLLSFGFRS